MEEIIKAAIARLHELRGRLAFNSLYAEVAAVDLAVEELEKLLVE